MIFSSGLGLLIDSYKKCNKFKVLFSVVNINAAIETVIHSAQIHKVIDVYNTLEEYEISEYEDGSVGTRVPPLDFSYEESDYLGYLFLICKGVMCEGPILNQLINTLKKHSTAIFDFSGLGFIDADCLDEIASLCQTITLFVYGANDIIKDEFKTFNINNHIHIKASMDEIQFALKNR